MSKVNLSIFKKEIDWKFVNYVHYLLTKYMDSGVVITFNVEIDMCTVYQIDNKSEGNFEIVDQSAVRYIRDEYIESGFNYIFLIKKENDEVKDLKSTVIINALMNKISEKYNVQKIDKESKFFVTCRFSLS